MVDKYLYLYKQASQMRMQGLWMIFQEIFYH